jgi:hypothetical protein
MINKIYISHRGNTNSKNIDYENNLNYIDNALIKYNVEIDIWKIDSKLFLGHDKPQYSVHINWLLDRQHKLWIHCKNIASLEYFNQNQNQNLHYFWHENDTVAMTNRNYIWAFPGKQPILNSIAVLPEIYNDITSQSLGICSDIIERYYNE